MAKYNFILILICALFALMVWSCAPEGAPTEEGEGAAVTEGETPAPPETPTEEAPEAAGPEETTSVAPAEEEAAEEEPAEPAAEPVAGTHPGEQVFADNCSACHDAADSTRPRGLAGVGGSYDDAGFRAKLDGHMGTSVTGGTLDDLVAYLLTLK